jgi:hypothetical protein
MKNPRHRPAPAALALALGVTLALAACQAPAPAPTLPPITFGQYGPLTFDVARIVVETPYASPMSPPHVEHLAPTTPEQALRRWVEDRLRAGGRDGTLRVVLKDGRITETKLPVAEGFQGRFRNEQAARYDGRMTVELVGEGAGRRVQGYVEATVERSTTIAENASPFLRDRALHELVQEMARELNYRLETGALSNMAPFVSRR